MKRLSDGVYLEEGSITLLTEEMIIFLRNECLQAEKKRARINFHQSSSDLVQEMIVAIHRDSFIPPHRHFNKSESFHLIEGELTVVIIDEKTFDEKTRVTLSASSFERYYRLNSCEYHLVIPRTEIVIIHETTQGPFVQGEGYCPDTHLTPAKMKALELIRSSII